MESDTSLRCTNEVTPHSQPSPWATDTGAKWLPQRTVQSTDRTECNLGCRGAARSEGCKEGLSILNLWPEKHSTEWLKLWRHNLLGKTTKYLNPHTGTLQVRFLQFLCPVTPCSPTRPVSAQSTPGSTIPEVTLNMRESTQHSPHGTSNSTCHRPDRLQSQAERITSELRSAGWVFPNSMNFSFLYHLSY